MSSFLRGSHTRRTAPPLLPLSGIDQPERGFLLCAVVEFGTSRISRHIRGGRQARRLASVPVRSPAELLRSTGTCSARPGEAGESGRRASRVSRHVRIPCAPQSRNSNPSWSPAGPLDSLILVECRARGSVPGAGALAIAGCCWRVPRERFQRRRRRRQPHQGTPAADDQGPVRGEERTHVGPNARERIGPHGGRSMSVPSNRHGSADESRPTEKACGSFAEGAGEDSLKFN